MVPSSQRGRANRSTNQLVTEQIKFQGWLLTREVSGYLSATAICNVNLLGRWNQRTLNIFTQAQLALQRHEKAEQLRNQSDSEDACS